MADFGPDGLTCPLDPSIKLYGVVAKSCSVFKSAVQPMKMTFTSRKFSIDREIRATQEFPELGQYSVVFKNGDDTRQDSLVNNMVAIMDYLLKQVRYDFKFTPFKVLAASPNDGILEFVPSRTITEAQNLSNGNLQTYLIGLNSDPVKQKKILDTYLWSCAGYAVATYLLAIGDRHLENLMVTENGNFFHLDFGFILGRNPKGKQNYSPIRLNSEIIKGMGGEKSKGYEEFKDKTIDAFLQLRNHRHYLLNILTLMVDAKLKDLPEDDYARILREMNNRFLPGVSNEEAREIFAQIIHESVHAIFANLVYEPLHNLAVWWKY